MDERRFPPDEVDPWAATEGLPEVADDDSYADAVREAARDPAQISSIPPDREHGPYGLDEYGVTPDQGLRGEPLADRLRRELPEVGQDLPHHSGQYLPARWSDDRMELDPRISADQDLDEPGFGDRPDPAERAAEDTWLVNEDQPVDPHLGSQVSMYDRPEPGIGEYHSPPGRVDIEGNVGELVRPGSGYPSYEADEVATDLGAGLGGLAGEEQAMHEVPEEEMDFEDAQASHEPYVTPGPERTYIVRTGADQPWDPEDLAVAEGRDPTPSNVERARRELEQWGQAAIEKTVP